MTVVLHRGSTGIQGRGRPGLFGEATLQSSPVTHRTKSRKDRIESEADPEGGAELTSELLWVGDLEKQAGLSPPAQRAVSVFEMKTPLDLLPQHSALLPFMKESVSAKTIVWFSSLDAAPERAIGITNNTVNTLPEGLMAVFDRDGFLGETMLSSLQPGARQFARIGEASEIDLSSTRGSDALLLRHVDYRPDGQRVMGEVAESQPVHCGTSGVAFPGHWSSTGRARRASGPEPRSVAT
jgi:hypothetical protein